MQLDGDSLLQCLEHHVERNGNQQTSGVLTLTKTIGSRLHPIFYRNIFLFSSRNLYPLLDTLTKHPERCRFVNSLWVRLGKECLSAPAFKDNTYPRNYTPYLLLPVHISRLDVGSLSKTLNLVAPTITRLTITAKTYYSGLRDSLAVADFPNLIEMEVPVNLVLHHGSEYVFKGVARLPQLRRLRLIYMSEADDAMEVLPYQDFSQLSRLTHLYLAYWAESRGDVEHSLVNLRVPPCIKVVVLEQDAGLHLPIAFDNLGQYTIHPKVLLVIEKGILEQFDRILGYSARMRTVHGTCLVLDVTTVRDEYMWERAEEKVNERCTLFNRIPPSMLVTKWIDGFVVHKLR
ncbi:hypothetical protein VNI00_015575 [Paramarasmius palmivorus]|uniref:Uncharacterized protein n=1 Tax=Paramarasmius palmivorus TaxID=297713 RepID=A0AAW0BMI5_9AGAR